MATRCTVPIDILAVAMTSESTLDNDWLTQLSWWYEFIPVYSRTCLFVLLYLIVLETFHFPVFLYVLLTFLVFILTHYVLTHLSTDHAHAKYLGQWPNYEKLCSHMVHQIYHMMAGRSFILWSYDLNCDGVRWARVNNRKHRKRQRTHSIQGIMHVNIHFPSHCIFYLLF